MRNLLLLLVAMTSLHAAYSQVTDRCGSVEAVKQQMLADPAYAWKVIELMKNKGNYSRQNDYNKGRPSSITIPVVVHIVYNTPEQNISDAQVQTQIDVLNEDFTATNRDYRNYDAGYGAVKGDMDIKFCLVQVIRKQTKTKSFPANDNMKYSNRGGSDAVDPMHVFNIWVCNLGQNLLGYAYYPGIKPEKFGVVCHVNAFGRGSQYKLFADYNLGRTTTHEVGHSFGLVHIWGDANCGNDQVDDTPLHNTANFGCPEQGHLSTCTGTPLEMWMNYMDYTDDRCMYFFSAGQSARASFFIDTDPQLNSIVNSVCSNQRGNNNDVTTAGSNQSAITRNSLVNNLSLYPTITAGKLTLSLENSTGGNTPVRIYGQSGSLMMTRYIYVAKGIGLNNLDVSKLANGVYFLQLGEGAEKITKKFFVQH